MPTMNRFGILCLGAACAAVAASFTLNNEAEANVASALALVLMLAAIKLAGAEGFIETDEAAPHRTKDSE